jgi:hypothetical protein
VSAFNVAVEVFTCRSRTPRFPITSHPEDESRVINTFDLLKNNAFPISLTSGAPFVWNFYRSVQRMIILRRQSFDFLSPSLINRYSPRFA